HERGELVRFGPPRRYDYALVGSEAAQAGAAAALSSVSLPAAPAASLGAATQRLAPSHTERLDDRVLAVLTRFDLTVEELHTELSRGTDEVVS
ncbi:hypothetical protein ABTC48_20085, partial [Acinetobacter baumannii]